MAVFGAEPPTQLQGNCAGRRNPHALLHMHDSEHCVSETLSWEVSLRSSIPAHPGRSRAISRAPIYLAPSANADGDMSPCEHTSGPRQPPRRLKASADCGRFRY
jgi:hypothetical protein